MLDVLSLFFGNRVDIPAHIGFLLMAVSLFLTNIFWLRVFLILSFLFQIVYFSLSDTPLYTGIAYNVVFILINLYRLVSLQKARRLVDAATGGPLLRAELTGLDDEHIATLIEFGEAFELPKGAPLTVEGEAVDAVYLIQAGRAVVEAGGAKVGSLGPGEFVGEVSFLTGIAATATVRAETDLSVIALDSARLKAAGEADPVLSAAIHAVIGRELARKLAASNRRKARPAG